MTEPGVIAPGREPGEAEGMSRSKHGHPHVGRAKCGVCSLAGVRGAKRAARERVDVPEAIDQALRDHGEPCPEGCCPWLPDIEAADAMNDAALKDCECFDGYVCNVCAAMWPSDPLKVPLLELL